MTLPERAKAGEPLRYPADFFNLQVDMAEAFQKRQLSGEANGPTFRQSSAQIVYVKNNSSYDMPQFGALRISGILFTPTDRLIEFKQNWAFKADETGDNEDPICVFQEPAPIGKIRRAAIDGMTPVKLNVNSNNQAYAILDTTNHGELKTDESQGCEIIYKAGTSGEQWAIVRLGKLYHLTKPIISFSLAAALTTSDASKTGTIIAQYGPGIASTATGTGEITVYNMVTSTAYAFEGDSADRGIAAWDSGTSYRILNMECP